MDDKQPKINQELYEKMFDLIHEAVYIVNPENQIVYINQAGCLLEGASREHIIGRTVNNLAHYTKLDDDTLTPSGKVLKYKKSVINQKCEWYSMNGIKLSALINNYPLIQGKEVMGVISICDDLNELKKKLRDHGLIGKRRQIQYRKSVLNNGTRYEFQDLIGESESVKNLINNAKKFAQRNFPILICGETGTGKEILAQSIHNESTFSKGKFMAVNCASIPPTLIESTLFGTKKGAYTDAVDKPGLLEMAENGTVFLDEINSMPLDLQSKLLRVLEEKEIQRVGDTRIHKINCRILSAMNQPPEEILKANTFREDLFYRLSTGVLIVPPLRERYHDIELLTTHLIDSINQELLSQMTRPSTALLNLFYSYSWPGNIRELSNTVEMAMNMADFDEEVLDVQHIPAYIRNKFLNEDPVNTFQNKQPPNKNEQPFTAGTKKMIAQPLKEMVGQYEKQLIDEFLTLFQGNLSKCSQNLGITRQGLMKKIIKYELNLGDYKKGEPTIGSGRPYNKE